MNEKIKKRLMECGYKLLIAAIILLVISALDFFLPEVAEKTSVIWTKNTDLKKTGELLLEALKELNPF